MPVFLHVSEASRKWARQLDDSFERLKARHSLTKELPAEKITEMSATEFRKWLDNSTLSYKVLVEMKQDVAAICGDINSQIATAKTEAALNGKYMPVIDFRRLEWERSMYSAKYGALEVAIRKRKKFEKKRASAKMPFEAIFMDVAREKLDKDTFDMLFKSTRNRVDELRAES